MSNMNQQFFNPFEDRTSRDIRNDLSEALVKAIQTGDKHYLNSVVDGFLEQQTADCYRAYIIERSSKYEKALQDIENKITEPIQQGLVLWNHGLFFEFHEIVEHTWYHETDMALKQTMQALIRCAGVYIKREYGFMDSAARIAGKALPVLLENQALLSLYFQPEKLLSVLTDPDQPPPQLS